MVGASAAWLARKAQPDWHIVLIDRALAGHGTSLYSASLDIPYGHTPLRRALSTRSQSLFKELSSAISDLPIGPLKIYGLSDKSQAADVLSNFIDENTRIAADEELQTLKATWPGLHVPENSALLTDTIGSRALKNQVAIQIAQAFTKTPNSTLFEGTEVCEIESTPNQHSLKTSQQTTIRAKRLIQAIGPWVVSGPEVDHMKERGIRVKKIVALHINQQPRPDDPVFHFFDDDAFLMPQHNLGQWLFSFRCEQWDVIPEISQLTIDKTDLDLAKTVLSKYYPEWLHSISGGRVFCDAYAPSGEPLIMNVPGKSNYVIAGACSGSGYRLGPAIAERALSLLEATNKPKQKDLEKQEMVE